jgi:hypothetical protein
MLYNESKHNILAYQQNKKELEQISSFPKIHRQFNVSVATTNNPTARIFTGKKTPPNWVNYDTRDSSKQNLHVNSYKQYFQIFGLRTLVLNKNVSEFF